MAHPDPKRPSSNLRVRILFPLLCGLAILLVTFALGIARLQDSEMERNRVRSLAAAEDLMATHLGRDASMMHAALHVMTGDEAARSALADLDRERLMSLMEARFRALKEANGLTHLYFVRPDRTTLVRVHRPDLFDDLIGRRTMLTAEATRRPVHGLEVGRYRGQMTMRVIHPWYDGDTLLGYIELGKEVGQMLDDMASTLEIDLFVILDKQFVERSYWEDGMRALGREADWDALTTGLVVHQTLDELPAEISASWSRSEWDLERVTVGSRYMHGGSLPIMDVAGEDLGRLVVLRDATPLITRARISMWTTSGIAVLVGLALLVALVPFLGRLERKIKMDFRHLQEAQAALKVARDDALAASEAKSEFLASMSHEIRTPMNGVMGMTELILATDLDADQRSFANTIRGSARGLLALINEILDFSKVEAGRLELQSAEFSPSVVFRDIQALLAHGAEEKDLDFELSVESTSEYTVIGDEGRLRQVLINLVANAIKFTAAGHVKGHLKMQESGQKEIALHLTISDTGIGIPKDQLEGIFDRFNQVDASNTRGYGGTGLGLAISKQLVELMGGTLDVESEDGEGSTFTLRLALPRGQQRVPSVETPSGADGAINALSPLPFTARVLLVEDNAVNQRVAQRMLSSMGCEVTIASNGQEGFEAAKDAPYDVVFMDCQMPVLDGFDATIKIRKLEGANETMPIVALTANALEADRERAFDVGMNGFLTKPIAAAELRAALIEWVRNKVDRSSAA